MDSKSGATRELLEILRLAGAEWTDRSWRTCVVKPSSDEGDLGIDKPTFCYFWEAGDSPVEVAFVTHGRVAARKSRTMLIEIGRRLIRVSIPGRKPLVVPDLDPVVSERMAELIPNDTQAAKGSSHPWHDELELVSAAMRLIALSGQAVLGPTNSGNDSAADSSLAADLHDWLGHNPGKPIKLADAAQRFGRNPRPLVRLLKRTTGTGFTEHLNLHRLMLARSLLMRTDRSVVDIARECGFNSREPFIRSFSKAFDWTPLQFRKAWIHASFSGEEAPELCRISGRTDVRWLPDHESDAPAQAAGDHPAITLVVGNALQELVELSKVTSHGQLIRHEILESGRMVVVAETRGGSLWHAQAMDSGRSGYFVTPDSHAEAVIGSDTLGSK